MKESKEESNSQNKQTNGPDRDVLLSMYSQAWDLYKHEDGLCEERNAQFLNISSMILTVSGGLIAYSANQIQAAYIDYLNNEVYTDQKLSAAISSILQFLVIVFFIMMLVHWHSVNKRAHEYVIVRLKNAKKIENALVENHFVEEGVCIALNDKKNLSTGEAKKMKRKEKSGGSGTTESIIWMFGIAAGILGLLDLAFIWALFFGGSDEPFILWIFKNIK